MPRRAYVTALGATDTAGGWRANKANGGLLIDVASGEAIAAASRCRTRRASTTASSGCSNPATAGSAPSIQRPARSTTVAELPGFTRGLDSHGPFAFIGLSQVRESAVFNGLAICEPGRTRECGVWVVDTRSGETVAFLRFSGSVQEIFAIQVLPVRWPELLNEDHELLSGAFFVPPEAIAPAPQTDAPVTV